MSIGKTTTLDPFDEPALENDHHQEYEGIETNDSGHNKDNRILLLTDGTCGETADCSKHGELGRIGSQIE